MVYRYLSFIMALVLMWSCNDSVDAKTGNEILSFVVEGQTSESIINSEQASVYAQVDTSVNLEQLKPLIVVSEKANINPASGIETNFAGGVVMYKVTAENGEIKNWNVTVEKQKSDDAKILSFYLSRQQEPAVFTDTNISVQVKMGTNLATLKPVITISKNATINPASEQEVDFSNGPVIYTVTAESGMQQQWLVTVEGDKIYPAEILTFEVPNQIGETVFEGSNLYIEVPLGYNLTNVIPVITITQGTTVTPKSGDAVNFATTGYVDYTVTTEINTKKRYRVFLAEEIIKANNPNIQYMGRVDFTNPLKPRLHAPGATINAKFSGTFCQIILDDQELYGSYHNYLQIVVDGEQLTRIQTTGKKNTIDIVKNLSEDEHTLSITKNTEAGIGYIDFIGLRCQEILEPAPLPTRKIEFIGNSITCGYGIDDTQIGCGQGQWYDQHSAYFAYGPLVARRLNAQWMQTSVSGIGLIKSCCDMTYTMPQVYETVSLSVTGKAWDFSNYQANVVTICLGQNDGVQDSVTFCSAYVNFIGTIRAKYPEANIVCITSPMADDYLFNSQKNYLTGIVNHINDNKVTKLFLTPKLNSGCDAHPSMDENKITANELEVYLKDLMNW